MNNLKCTVTNCAYNSNTYCTAENVKVDACGDGFVNSADGTACRTFKPKNNNNMR
ncbi:gel scht [Fervidicella metallireducens AeB]|uniref:Gel scht n=2 Tax=Fervidicella TaxID=1403538 RepID=A0A017RX85_9CLOT|nr:gel scht [Fervidicella metallireducens AeB]